MSFAQRRQQQQQRQSHAQTDWTYRGRRLQGRFEKRLPEGVLVVGTAVKGEVGGSENGWWAVRGGRQRFGWNELLSKRRATIPCHAWRGVMDNRTTENKTRDHD